jgi:hypothetical protein
MRIAVSHASVGDSDMPIRVGATGNPILIPSHVLENLRVAGRGLPRNPITWRPDKQGWLIGSSLMALNRAKGFRSGHFKPLASNQIILARCMENNFGIPRHHSNLIPGTGRTPPPFLEVYFRFLIFNNGAIALSLD